MTQLENSLESAAKIKSSTQKNRKAQIISWYMESVLTNEKKPTSVFKFSKDHGITEVDFYESFGSFEGLQMEIWNSFYYETIRLAHQDEAYSEFSSKEKMLTFFFTFFEILTLNRSYILFIAQDNKDWNKNLAQLKELRSLVKEFSNDISADDDLENNESKIRSTSRKLFSEGVWVQMLILIKYWLEDSSASFEKTDIAIEKSVRVIFDVFDTTAFESVVDFGKFLWKESNL